MADADNKSSKVIQLKKRISEELNEIDKDINSMEKSKKDSVEKIEIKKVELKKKFSNTQAVCDEHYATLQEIEQASKLIEDRKTSITALDTTIANLDLQISQIQSEHDKAVAELEKKRRKLNDYLKYYEDLNDKLEKLIELLGEEERKHCIELNNLKVERAKTLERTDLSEGALNKLLAELDNKMVDLNEEHGKLIDSISQKLSEITIDASEVEELLSKGKKKSPKKKKSKEAGDDADEDETDEDDEEKKVVKEKTKKEPKETKAKDEIPAAAADEEKEKDVKDEEVEEKPKDEPKKEVRKETKTKMSLSQVREQLQPKKKPTLTTDQDDYHLDLTDLVEEEQKPEEEKEEHTDEDYRESDVPESEDWDEPITKDKKKVKKKTLELPVKKPKKKKEKRKGIEYVEEEEDDDDESLDEELLDWFASKEKDIRSDLLRQGLQITPSNKIITKDDRVITLKQAQRLGMLNFFDEDEEEEEEEVSSEGDFDKPRGKKKKLRDKQAKFYKSPASSASTLGKESSESHICGRDVEYLKVVFGKSLTIALAEITAKQPADPIHYLAHWMLKYRYNQEIDQITRIQIQELMIEQERLAAEKWHRELQEEARLAVLEALFRAENIIIQQDFQSELQLREYEGEYDEESPPTIPVQV